MADTRGTGDEAFDKIVEGLDMNLSFPAPQHDDLDDIPDDPEDQFYRQVPPASDILPRNPRTLLAWIAVLGVPAVMVACTFVGYWLPRPVVIALGLTFVAGAIWLFSHLPERGPGRSDWPDDGAAL